MAPLVTRRPKDLDEELSKPEVYVAVALTGKVTIEQTHVSRVFLLDRDVFKIKKAVALGFLDFRELEQRRSACEAEVRLNARLSPHVYRGVVPVCLREDGHLALGGHGIVVDWAVHMVRLDDRLRADRRLADGTLTASVVEAIAQRVARFHDVASCGEAEARCGRRAAVERNVAENFEQTRELSESDLSPSEREAIVRFQSGFLRDGAHLFERRLREGRVRDGHGDLRLEHVYVGDDGDVTIVDCIEFNERFRFGDVAADVAFFSMDLAAHGRDDLAERFLAAYARASNDFDLYAMVDFYESYRAFVRGKVSAMTAGDAALSDVERSRAHAAARRYFEQAARMGRPRGKAPMLVAVGGLMGSGKSTIADHLSGMLQAPVVDADRTRKAMLGVGVNDPVRVPPWQGPYDPAFTERVYAELSRRARVVLASRRPVIVDASFRTAKMRAAIRALAGEIGVPFRFVECRADPEVCRHRLARRETTTTVSDGRLAIFDDFRKNFEPIVELGASEHVVVDTTGPVEASADALRRAFEDVPDANPPSVRVRRG